MLINLKKYRLKAGMNQEQLANKIGVARATITAWERNHKNTPDFITGIHICKALDITPYQLAGIPMDIPNETIESIKQILDKTKTKLQEEAKKDMLNQVQLMGRLVENPGHHRTGPSGSVAISFTLAVDRDYIDKSTKERGTDFIDITAWGKLADWCQNYLTKGQMVCVSGRIRVSSYTDKTGSKRRSFEIVASDIYFAGARPDPKPDAPKQNYNQPKYTDLPDNDTENLPF